MAENMTNGINGNNGMTGVWKIVAPKSMIEKTMGVVDPKKIFMQKKSEALVIISEGKMTPKSENAIEQIVKAGGANVRIIYGENFIRGENYEKAFVNSDSYSAVKEMLVGKNEQELKYAVFAAKAKIGPDDIQVYIVEGVSAPQPTNGAEHKVSIDPKIIIQSLFAGENNASVQNYISARNGNRVKSEHLVHSIVESAKILHLEQLELED